MACFAWFERSVNPGLSEMHDVWISMGIWWSGSLEYADFSSIVNHILYDLLILYEKSEFSASRKNDFDF